MSKKHNRQKKERKKSEKRQISSRVAATDWPEESSGKMPVLNKAALPPFGTRLKVSKVSKVAQFH